MKTIYGLLTLVAVVGLVVTGSFGQALADPPWWEKPNAGGDLTDIIEGQPAAVPGKYATASRINWQDGYIEIMAGATADMKDAVNMAHAYSLATKTARHLAYEKLAETVAGINLYSDATYDRELQMDSNLKTVVKALVRNARVVSERQSQFPDGSIWVEVVLGMTLYGDGGLAKPTVEWRARNPESIGAPLPLPPVAAIEASPKPKGPYTGLIIDAGGLGGRPAMMPKVLSEDGSVIYGTVDVTRDAVINLGLIGYQATVDQATKLDRVGDNPLVVKAIDIKGARRTDFVLTRADAERIKAAAAENDFFNGCHVAAVLN